MKEENFESISHSYCKCKLCDKVVKKSMTNLHICDKHKRRKQNGFNG